jgi:NO-binding membrane sensor protein with MHYT domain
MAAMIMPARISYDPMLFVASIVIAIVASTVALWLAFNLRGNLQRFGSAFVMGIAVCGMHYTGMYALRLVPAKEAITDTGIALSPANMAYMVFGATAVILTLLLAYSTWKSQRTLTADL